MRYMLASRLASIALLGSPVVCFSPDEAGNPVVLPDLTAPAAGTAPVAAVAKTPKAPKFAAIRADLVPPPAGKRGGGEGPGEQYPFGALEVGQSFGVQGRTAKRMASTVYSAMVRFGKTQPAIDKDGKPRLTKAGKPEMTLVKTRVFIVRDVDPATDPDGASVRIWRIADDTSGKSETVEEHAEDAATA